jgi:hypothetical protein
MCPLLEIAVSSGSRCLGHIRNAGQSLDRNASWWIASLHSTRDSKFHIIRDDSASSSESEASHSKQTKVTPPSHDLPHMA